jgi:hypothetical protein
VVIYSQHATKGASVQANIVNDVEAAVQANIDNDVEASVQANIDNDCCWGRGLRS